MLIHSTHARDYSQDLDAILMSKPASLQVEQISMWQDHVGNVLAKSSAVLTGSGGTGECVEVEEAEDTWSFDYKRMFQNSTQTCFKFCLAGSYC